MPAAPLLLVKGPPYHVSVGEGQMLWDVTGMAGVYKDNQAQAPAASQSSSANGLLQEFWCCHPSPVPLLHLTASLLLLHRRQGAVRRHRHRLHQGVQVPPEWGVPRDLGAATHSNLTSPSSSAAPDCLPASASQAAGCYSPAQTQAASGRTSTH